MHAKQAMCKTSEQPVLLGSLEGELDVEAFSGYQTSCSTSADSRSDRLLELVG